MLRYLADEDFDNRILKAFRRREPGLDWTRVQDNNLSGCHDELVLQFAAESQRIVLTRDVSTMTATAFGRIARGEPMRGLIVVPHRMAIGQAVDELIFLASESEPKEWNHQMIWLPL